MDTQDTTVFGNIRSAALHLGAACEWAEVRAGKYALQRGEQNWTMQLQQIEQDEPYALFELLPAIGATVQHSQAAGVTQAGTAGSAQQKPQPSI